MRLTIGMTLTLNLTLTLFLVGIVYKQWRGGCAVSLVDYSLTESKQNVERQVNWLVRKFDL